MSMKICPVCDKQVNSINFCTTCKKFVRPKIVYTNTVLNESRTQDKSDGDLYVEMMKDEDRSKRKITGTAVIIMLIIMAVILVIGVMAVLPRAKEKNASKKADEIVDGLRPEKLRVMGIIVQKRLQRHRITVWMVICMTTVITRTVRRKSINLP